MRRIIWASVGAPVAKNVLLEDGSVIGFGPALDTNGNTITMWIDEEDPDLTEADVGRIILAFRGENDPVRIKDLARLAQWLDNQRVPPVVAYSVFRDAAEEAAAIRWGASAACTAKSPSR